MTLDEGTAERLGVDPLVLLDELSCRGLSWFDVARCCGVSVAVVRKWRNGESLSPEQRFELARFSTFVELLDETPVVVDLFVRLVDGFAPSAADLYLDGRVDDLLLYASGGLGVEELLDRWNPSWREDVSDWQVVVASDGQRSIVLRSSL